MPASPQDPQATADEIPFGWREIDRIITQTRKLVRQMVTDALTRIHQRAEAEASS